MKPVRLRFTGEHPETFSTANVGTVEPGAEFSVPEDMADRFLVRRDIEPVDGPPRPRRNRQEGDQGTSTGSGDAETGTGSPDPGAANSGETDPST